MNDSSTSLQRYRVSLTVLDRLVVDVSVNGQLDRDQIVEAAIKEAIEQTPKVHWVADPDDVNVEEVPIEDGTETRA